MRHHASWVVESNIITKDRSFHEHLLLCEALESLACIDQLNLPNIWGVEQLVRRLMLLEDAHADPSGPDWEAAEFFSDLGRSRGGARVAPALIKHVSGKQTERNARNKEKRQAQEHRRVAPKNPKGKGKDKGGDAPT